MITDLKELFGEIDIYLFDQLMKGRITKEMRILDAGCGSGRNLVYLLRSGYEVYAIDRSEAAILEVQRLGAAYATDWSSEQARVEPVELMSFADASFDFVISSAVLHFADNEAHFEQMVNELWRVLAPGGKLFARLASSIGMESSMQPIGDGRYLLPDGSRRFLVNEERILGLTEQLNGQWYEPLKTVIVAGKRCMTTWSIQKPG
ncbi:class I SAM-dependent methyltransferase [Paenibacillus sp. LHD-38]|uniref:class I SAM-dependent methyltransferase n=1 Tax=Paenibacillus sp. LHD-38 TaxID=3072143 RepID=UPI00280FA78B|nr:class I SAM-dependent methyltransferase [Paenibacillus sp. LHD-38]MDQ8738200.1 class I SAM-dependent methyltransferase [Paenibacillus sp. LHD-38]